MRHRETTDLPAAVVGDLHHVYDRGRASADTLPVRPRDVSCSVMTFDFFFKLRQKGGIKLSHVFHTMRHFKGPLVIPTIQPAFTIEEHEQDTCRNHGRQANDDLPDPSPEQRLRTGICCIRVHLNFPIAISALFVRRPADRRSLSPKNRVPMRWPDVAERNALSKGHHLLLSINRFSFAKNRSPELTERVPFLM